MERLEFHDACIGLGFWNILDLKLIAHYVKINQMVEKNLEFDKSAIVKDLKYRILFITVTCIFLILMGIPQLHLGYLRFGQKSLTLMHIPVLAAVFFTGLSGAFISSLLFGILSFISAFAVNGGILSDFFMNPLCSVLPRLLFGFIAWWIFSVSCKRITVVLSAGISAFAASFLHSFMVIGSVYVFSYHRAIQIFKGAGYFELMQKLISGVLLEAFIAAVLLFLIILIVRKIKPCKGGN